MKKNSMILFFFDSDVTNSISVLGNTIFTYIEIKFGVDFIVNILNTKQCRN